LRLAIFTYLSGICFTETDYPNSRLGFRKAQHMQPAVQVAQRDVTGFAICLSGVREHQRSIEIDFCRSLEREPTLFDVSLILDRVEVNFHALECMHKKAVRQCLLYAQLCRAFAWMWGRTLLWSDRFVAITPARAA
jgi:hypothetical protein